jgi:hypothetical protein
MAKLTGVRVPANRSFERELAALEALSGRMPDEAGLDRVRKALSHENNYLVAKAARVVAENALKAMLPEVLSAYNRFFNDPIKSDPQCWAKNALVKALVNLECRDPLVYLRGLKHRQEEPVWGGQSDTAGALRGTCTHALVLCESLSNTELLELLLDPLVDLDKTVRVEAVRAIAHVGGKSAALLLKLRVLLRKEEPEIMGECFTALLSLADTDKQSMIALIADFLDDEHEAASEAAFALADTHDEAALSALIERRGKRNDLWFTSVLDHAIALTRLPRGLDFLLKVISQDDGSAASALEAISRAYHYSDVRSRVFQVVDAAGSDRLRKAFWQYFPEESLQA